MDNRQIFRLMRHVLVLLALPPVGMLGFMLIEGWDWFDALYMAFITITTVGYGETHPLSTGGRVFVMAYLITGIGLFSFSIAELGGIVIRAELTGWWARRRMERILHKVRDHFVVCGFGRMGRRVCRHLADKGLPFVALDRSAESLAAAEAAGWLHVVGDATEEDALAAAGLERARGLAAVLPDEAANLYIVLTARMLAPRLRIIARAEDEKAAAKLRRAGADRVVGLYETGAGRAVALLANPNLEDLIGIDAGRGAELDLAEIQVSAGDRIAGRRLNRTDLRSAGILVVGVRRPDGSLLLPPPPDTEIRPGDTLMALGRAEAVKALVERPG